MKLIVAKQRLEEENLKIFTLLEFQRFFDVSSNTAQRFLQRNTKNGHFVRLKKGLYGLKNLTPYPFIIANKLYQPSYISFESALSFHHLIPETVYSITSATTKPSREFSALGQHFIYTSIKKTVYQGYAPNQQNGAVVLIAEPEKALADILYLVNLGKKKLPERVDMKKINKKKLKQFIENFKRPNLMEVFNDFKRNNRKTGC